MTTKASESETGGKEILFILLDNANINLFFKQRQDIVVKIGPSLYNVFLVRKTILKNL